MVEGKERLARPVSPSISLSGQPCAFLFQTTYVSRYQEGNFKPRLPCNDTDRAYEKTTQGRQRRRGLISFLYHIRQPNSVS